MREKMAVMNMLVMRSVFADYKMEANLHKMQKSVKQTIY